MDKKKKNKSHKGWGELPDDEAAPQDRIIWREAAEIGVIDYIMNKGWTGGSE